MRWYSAIGSLGLALCGGGCVTEPEGPLLSDRKPLLVETNQGLVSATIERTSGALDGESVFIVLQEPRSARLTRADAFMPAHNHGTDSPVVIEQQAGYRIEQVFLFMPGRWEISIEFVLDGKLDSLTFAYDVAR